MQPRQSLTKCFHVVVKVLAVDQFPGGTEGVGHGGGSSQSNLRIALSRVAASSATFPPLLLLFRSLSLCMEVGGARAPHWLRRSSLSYFIGCLKWVTVLLTLLARSKKKKELN